MSSTKGWEGHALWRTGWALQRVTQVNPWVGGAGCWHSLAGTVHLISLLCLSHTHKKLGAIHAPIQGMGAG